MILISNKISEDLVSLVGTDLPLGGIGPGEAPMPRGGLLVGELRGSAQVNAGQVGDAAL